MSLVRSISGMVRVRIISADPTGSLSAMAREGISATDVFQTDGLTTELSIRRQDLKTLEKLMERKGSSIKILSRNGIWFSAVGLLRRPVLFLGMALLLIFGLYLPSRVLFVRVEGNSTVPTKRILEKAAQCGIGFGASRREVRSEKMKNSLLEAIPELQWAGVNTSGCVATISVEERSVTQEQETGKGVSSLVAARDGVITECTVRNGNGLCKVGQAVKAGEVLISGYTDCGLSIRATRAEGEIFALTQRSFVAASLPECEKQAQEIRQEKKFSLRIGKNQINFFKGSGISDATCDKMYLEYYMTLPGGFQLPVALIVEEFTYYDCTQTSVPQEDTTAMLETFARSYLLDQMVAGQILEEQTVFREGRLYGEFSCLEMIGRVRSEEIINYYGKTD